MKNFFLTEPFYGNRYPIIWGALFVVSFWMLFVSAKFYINDFAHHPQFAIFEEGFLQLFFAIVKETPDADKWFTTFFVLDFFFPLFIAALLYCYFKDNRSALSLRGIDFYPFSIGLLMAMVLSDYTENFLYILSLECSNFITSIEATERIKRILIHVALILALLVFYKTWLKGQLDNLLKIIKSSTLSILSILAIILLLTQMDQGSSLVIELFESPLNLGATLLMLIILALALSHHPSTFLFLHNREDDKLHGKWVMGKGFLDSWLVYFVKDSKSGDTGESNGVDELAKPIRYFIGAFLYFAFIYVLLFTYEKFIWNGFPATPLLLVLVGLKVVLLFFLSKRFKTRAKEGEGDDNTGDPTRKYPFYKAYLWSNFLLLLLFASSLIFSTGYGWHRLTLIAVLGFLYLRAIKETYMRLFIPDGLKLSESKRGFLFFLALLDDKERNFLASFTNKKEIEEQAEYFPRKPIFIKWTAIAAAVFILLAHFPIVSFHINPILIFVLYLHLYYALLNALVKTYFYYNQEDNNRGFVALLYRNSFLSIVAIVGLIYFGNQAFTGSLPFDIHSLSEEEICHYEDYFLNGECSSGGEVDRNIYLASYGGGLRATAWNLLLMSALDDSLGSEESFTDRIRGISGVSGGALGQAFYPLIRMYQEEHKDSIIQLIGKGNFLSADLTYLFGADFLRLSSVPGLMDDRSRVAMKNYWRVISGCPCGKIDKTPYHLKWRQYHDALGYYPPLIINSTNINRRYGVAFPIDIGANEFNNIFPYSINMTEIVDHRTLSYLDVVSTSERFPIFSSTATIAGKGHFVDGGYFENSGILSLMNFRRYWNESLVRRLNMGSEHSNFPDSSVTQKTQDLLVIINNDPDSYLNKVLKESKGNKRKNDPFGLHVKSTGLLKSTTSALVSNFELPAYLQEYYVADKDPTVEAIPIYQPFPLRYNNVKNFLGGHPKDTADIRSILNQLDFVHTRIDTALMEYMSQNPRFTRAERMFNSVWNRSKDSKGIGKRNLRWEFAPPSLARMISGASYRYSAAMLYHEDVQLQMDSILNFNLQSLNRRVPGSSTSSYVQ
ncbi:MAG: hypothetical protein EA409_10410 [Saprospirales bacterium]|nr:MAG: hypothetical protein EA409_10410 [Saprospirales bacterium]